MNLQRVVIVGAGIGGLGMANILAKTGWEVHVYDKLARPGGRANILEKEGFCFDTGPSWYLMPEVFEHYFSLLEEKIEDYILLERLDPAYKVFFDYRDGLEIWSDLSKDLKTFDTLEPGAGKALQAYITSAESTYKLARDQFLYNPLRSVRGVFSVETISKLPKLSHLLATPLHSHVSNSFNELPLQQILEYPMVFLGASPFEAPSLYHLMSYLDFTQGVHYPKGGMYTVVEALYKIGKKLGVTYHFSANVEKIHTNKNRATGIEVGSEFIAADLVISGADLHHTETKLLPAESQSYPEEYWQRKTAGPSALLMYLGVKGALPQLQHHNLFFIQEWQKNFTDIFDKKIWPEPASLYVCKPSQTDRSVAPAGHENLFVLVPLPAGGQADPNYSDQNNYLAQIEVMAKIPDLRKRIVTSDFYYPNDFGRDFNAWQNTALGMSHLLKQSALWRPSSRSKKLDNLLYVGAGVQPGIGVPMCLISAELAFKHLTNDKSAGPLDSLRIPQRGWNV